MKHLTTFFTFCLVAISLKAQELPYDTFAVSRNMPVFYNRVKEQLTYPLAWQHTTGLTFDQWKVRGQQVLKECMENLPPAAAEYNMQVVDIEKRNGYEARKIVFSVSDWCRIPAYLLVPEGEGPFPAVIMLHDHGAHFTIGKEKMIRPFGVSAEKAADADDWVHRCYDDQYAGDYFAENGYVVLSIDALLWGDRGREEGASYETQQALASNFLQMGTSWGGLIVMDDVRSAEFLTTLPEVDPECIGAVGFSMGAHRAWMLSACTDVVKVTAAVCWMNTTDHLMTLTNNQNKGGSAYSMIIPGIRRFMDYPHVASLACPKPMLFFNGKHDKLFPVEGVESAYKTLREVWNDQQASDRLITRLWDEKHFYNKEMQRETLQFCNKWLKK